jgi:protein tyrosine phosphatase (PTP) superfamily phosphohydrolase (DUF442 family)
MTDRRVWLRRVLLAALSLLAVEQVWRHTHDYFLPERFATVEPGKIYRGAWQKPWPMRRIVRDYDIKTVVALAHPPDHPLVTQEKALASELGFRWVHIPVADERAFEDYRTIYDNLDRAADVVADPKNQPVFFHCHHGINRTSMVLMAYRMKHCGWTLAQAHDEVARNFDLVKLAQGSDFHYMEGFYYERVLPARQTAAGGSRPVDPPAVRR